ncbi:MAG: cyclic pyranopterin monophosphate synthase MoaC [Chloroflexi bacterium]|nr:cyclic pyranopterin monophosphate synthase MoaC [Chloroflexota bacterium]
MAEAIHIYTDGACLGNPGPGGWAAIIEQAGSKKAVAGREDETTNNRMEIMAAIKGLEATPERSEVTVYSDSQYLVNTMTRGWKRMANQDLWAMLDAVTGHRRVSWEWVRGHAGHPGNEEANTLANRQVGLPPESKGTVSPENSDGNAKREEGGARIFVGTEWDMHTKRGAWVAIVSRDQQPDTVTGDIINNTNTSRLELASVLEGLKHAEPSTRVEIHSFSEYVVNCGSGIWKRSANRDLWEEVARLLDGKEVAWIRDEGVPVARAYEKAAALLKGEAINIAPQMAGAGTGGSRLTHVDEQGRARMVDVGWKGETEREAVARGSVVMRKETLELIKKGQVEKGDVLTVARIAGIMGAKRTPDLIPLCHPIPLDQVTVDLELDAAGNAIHITATAKATARTGVEMEALTAVAATALTIYDMCKAIDRGMRIEGVRLVRKRGGKSGEIVLEE